MTVSSGEPIQAQANSISLDEVVAKALEGGRLSNGEALLLASPDLKASAEILNAASEMRLRGKGRIVTFSPKVFIPLTHMCRDFCGYCTFRKDPNQAGKDIYMTPEQVLDVASNGAALGLSLIHI